jgi:glycosyltransferase involved in cell wall biosynthesis
MTLHVGIDATTWWNARGFGRFTRELTRALVRRSESAGNGAPEFRYSLVIDHPPDDTLPEGAQVVSVRPDRAVTDSAVGSSSRSLKDVLTMTRIAARQRFDVFFFPAVYSYFPLFSRTPTVVAFHDTIAERYPDLVFPTKKNQLLWNLKCRLAKAQATRVMTVSRASAADLERFWGVSPLHIDVITEGAEPMFQPLHAPAQHRALRERLGIDPAARLLVYVGGLNPHKNLATLIRAMPVIVREHPDVCLAIVGDTSGTGFYDNYAELSAMVTGDGPLSRHVHFTGFISDEELVTIYNGATALVFPSLWEGFGLPAVEAMACGLPLLASRRGSLPEVIGDAGVFFDPLSEESVARTISDALGRPELMRQLSQRALERVGKFSWDRGAELAEQSFIRAAG